MTLPFMKQQELISELEHVAGNCRQRDQWLTAVVLDFLIAALVKGDESELADLCESFAGRTEDYFSLRPRLEVGNVVFLGRYGKRPLSRREHSACR